MKKLILAVLLFCASLAAFGQGATVLFPPATDQAGRGLPFARISFCTTPAVLDTLGNCTNTVTVYKDQALTQPYTSAILTDGVGVFPPNLNTLTSLWFSPAANLCFTLTTSTMQSPATNPCTPFSVGAAPGSSPSFFNMTATNNASVGAVLSAKDMAHTCDALFYAGIDSGAQVATALADSNCLIVSALNLPLPTNASSVSIPANKQVVIPCGLWVGATTAFFIGSTATLSGIWQNCTIVSTNSGTANIIDVPSSSQWWGLHDLSIRSEVARTAGAGVGGHGGNGIMERVVVYPVFDGVWFDTASLAGQNVLRDVQFTDGTGSPSAGSGGTWHCGFRNGGVSSGTVSGNTLHHVTAAMHTAFTDAGGCIQDGSDTIIIDGNSQFVANIGGVDSVGLHLELVAGGGAPSNIQVSDATFEGGLTKNSVVIDSGLNVKFNTVTFQSGLRGVLLTSCVACSFKGSTFHNNMQEGLRVASSAFGTEIEGNRFSDNSQQTTNTFDDIFIAAGITLFDITGNIHADFFATGKVCKWGVEVAAGASNTYTIKDLNPGSCGTGAVSDSGTGTNKFVCTMGAGCNFGSSSIQLMGSGSGTATIQVPAAAGTPTLTLPTATGTLGELSGSQTFFQACSGTANSSTTLGMQFVPGACTSSSTAVQLPVASAGTLTNLRVRCGTGGKVAGSGVFTLNKNGAGSALTCTVGTGTTCNDTTHSVSVAAGDTMQMVFTTQATETLADCAASWEKQ